MVQLLTWSWVCRHQLLNDEELGSLYDLLIDEAPQIRHAVGDLVYDHLIAHSSEGLLLCHICPQL